MRENYDYMEGSDSDQLTLAPFYSRPEPGALDDPTPSAEPLAGPVARSQAPGAPGEPTAPPDLGNNDVTEDIMDWKDQDQLMSVNLVAGLADPPGRRAMSRPEPRERARVDRRDLLYYLDDGRLEDPAAGELAENTETPVNADATATPRYKILEIPVRSGRRSNGARRRFLQEERDGHISILNLGGGPFPEFRLPRDRRQYMADDDESEEYFKTKHRDVPLPISQEVTEPPKLERKKIGDVPFLSKGGIIEYTGKNESTPGEELSKEYANLKNEISDNEDIHDKMPKRADDERVARWMDANKEINQEFL